MLWRVYGRTFGSICKIRYNYVSRVSERKALERDGDVQGADNLTSRYICGYKDIPNKQLPDFPLFSSDIKAKDVDYDLIVYDTYDYIDKLIGFRLGDIYFAMFNQYGISMGDERAIRIAKYIKYGTSNEREIMMLRYGFTFEDIEWLNECIKEITENEILFNEKVDLLDEKQRNIINPYYYKK